MTWMGNSSLSVCLCFLVVVVAMIYVSFYLLFAVIRASLISLITFYCDLCGFLVEEER